MDPATRTQLRDALQRLGWDAYCHSIADATGHLRWVVIITGRAGSGPEPRMPA